MLRQIHLISNDFELANFVDEANGNLPTPNNAGTAD